jgi:hypothetical protein
MPLGPRLRSKLIILFSLPRSNGSRIAYNDLELRGRRSIENAKRVDIIPDLSII